jgi:hypothetical protein
LISSYNDQLRFALRFAPTSEAIAPTSVNPILFMNNPDVFIVKKQGDRRRNHG